MSDFDFLGPGDLFATTASNCASTPAPTIDELIRTVEEFRKTFPPRDLLKRVICGGAAYNRFRRAVSQEFGNPATFGLEIEFDATKHHEWCELIYHDGSSELILPNGCRTSRRKPDPPASTREDVT